MPLRCQETATDCTRLVVHVRVEIIRDFECSSLRRVTRSISGLMRTEVMGGKVLKMSEEERDLGVIMHRSAKPSRQCAEASKKANSTVGMIRKTIVTRDTGLSIHILLTPFAGDKPTEVNDGTSLLTK